MQPYKQHWWCNRNRWIIENNLDYCISCPHSAVLLFSGPTKHDQLNHYVFFFKNECMVSSRMKHQDWSLTMFTTVPPESKAFWMAFMLRVVLWWTDDEISYLNFSQGQVIQWEKKVETFLVLHALFASRLTHAELSPKT